MNPLEILKTIEKLNKREYSEDVICLFKGYKNQNNSCFIISWLQAILSSKMFVDKLKGVRDPFEVTTELMQAIQTDLESKKTTKRTISLTDFINKWKGWDGFRALPCDSRNSLLQQNVSEFHLAMMNSLDEEIRKISRIQIEETLNHGDGSTSQNFDDAQMINVDVECGSISKSLNTYFSPEEIEEIGTSLKAEMCKSIRIFPQLLCIAINRNKMGRKSNQVTMIPMWLDMSKYSNNLFEGTTYYQLQSICCHIGSSVDEGHWITVKRALGHWILCNDRKIEVIEVKYKDKMLAELEDQILRNASFIIYESTEEKQFEAPFSLTNHDGPIPLHQTQVVMDQKESQEYAITTHGQIELPIDLREMFPNLSGKLYVKGGNIPTSIINTPSETEYKLFTSFIKTGQEVFSSNLFKRSDPGKANRDEVLRKLRQSPLLVTDDNRQISLQAESLMNFYESYLIRRKKSISTNDFSQFINELLCIEEEEEEEENTDECNKNDPFHSEIPINSDSDEDSEDIISDQFLDKISDMNIKKTMEEGADIDDNHNESYYDWKHRCKVLGIGVLFSEIKEAIKLEKKKKNESAKLQAKKSIKIEARQ